MLCQGLLGFPSPSSTTSHLALYKPCRFSPTSPFTLRSQHGLQGTVSQQYTCFKHTPPVSHTSLTLILFLTPTAHRPSRPRGSLLRLLRTPGLLSNCKYTTLPPSLTLTNLYSWCNTSPQKPYSSSSSCRHPPTMTSTTKLMTLLPATTMATRNPAMETTLKDTTSCNCPTVASRRSPTLSKETQVS